MKQRMKITCGASTGSEPADRTCILSSNQRSKSMEQKPASPFSSMRGILIIAGSTVAGILIGAVLTNVVTASIPWVPIGAGVGGALGVVLASRQAPAKTS